MHGCNCYSPSSMFLHQNPTSFLNILKKVFGCSYPVFLFDESWYWPMTMHICIYVCIIYLDSMCIYTHIHDSPIHICIYTIYAPDSCWWFTQIEMYDSVNSRAVLHLYVVNLKPIFKIYAVNLVIKASKRSTKIMASLWISRRARLWPKSDTERQDPGHGAWRSDATRRMCWWHELTHSHVYSIVIRAMMCNGCLWFGWWLLPRMVKCG